jgi:flagellar motor switch protein FliG
MAAKAAVKAAPATKILPGADKVAALLLTMGKPAAARLLKHFDDAELKEITQAAADLGPMSAPELETLIEEFAGEFAAGVGLLGTAKEVEKLLTGVLPPEQIASIMSGLLGTAAGGSVWDKLSGTTETALADCLAKEHPQTAALILSKLKPGIAAKTMSRMEPRLRNGVMRRMVGLGPVMDSAMHLVEDAVEHDLLQAVSKNAGSGAHAKLADIINKLDRDKVDDVLQSLAEAKPETAAALKSLLFRFEDIVKLSQKSRSTLFDQIPAERVVLALRATDATFRDAVLSSLASRARRMVESELESGDGAVNREVLDARDAIAELALAMAGRGEIELNASEKVEA